MNGQVAVINAAYNAYSVSAAFASCVGTDALLNGLTATGLAAVDTNASPNKLYVGYSVMPSGKPTYNAFAIGTR